MDGRKFRWSMCGVAFGVCLLTNVAWSAPLVPGTGQKIAKVGDDFEDESWKWIYNNPKSSHEQDNRVRTPGGQSTNGRWFESAKRGQPDLLRRVPTPEGGIPGSTGALMLATRQTGIPGRPSRQMQQDDLLLNVTSRVGGWLSVAQQPSCVVRVYLPPFEKWENRTGTSFGIRADVRGSKGRGAVEEYWPGFFIWFRSEHERRYNQDAAHLVLRAGSRGQDFRGPELTDASWWTFGMSFSADGQVHYFAKQGVEDLTAADHIASQYPYGYRCSRFHTFFFNIANGDDGRTWSTPWIIDDPTIYLGRPSRRTARR